MEGGGFEGKKGCLCLLFRDAPFEISVALKRVLKSALIADGVARGLNEVARSLDRFVYSLSQIGNLGIEVAN